MIREISDSYPNGVGTTFQYDDQNRLVSQLGPTTTDAVTGRVHTAHLTVQYDVDGAVAKRTTEDWGQLDVSYTQDPDFTDSRILQIKIPAPGQTGLDAARSISFTYTAGNRLETITDALGNITRYSYDSNGWNTGSVAPDGNIYRNTYSAVGELTATTLTGWSGDPNAPSPTTDLVLESRAYDPAGRLASVTDAMGRTTAYTYFDDNRLESTTIAAGTPDAIVAARYGYDAAGNVISECLNATASGCIKQLTYTVDNANRVTSAVIDPTGMNIRTASTFDNNDNLLSQTMTGGNATDSRRSIYTYDTAGRLSTSSVITDTQTITTKASYDQRGLLISQTDPRGNTSGASSADFTTTYRYDELGRQIAVSAPPVQTEAVGGIGTKAVATALNGYNTFGDLAETQSATGKIQTNTYNAGGQLIASVWPAYTAPGTNTAVTPIVRYAYDKIGQLTTLTDPYGKEQTYRYDQLGNQVTQTLQDGRAIRISYDTVGEALSTTDASGARSEATYNALGQPITATQIVRGAQPAAYTTKFAYDAVGNLTSVTDPRGITSTRAYNSVGLVTSETDALGSKSTVDYNYAGQPAKATAADGTSIAYAYDLAGRLTSVADQAADGTALRTTSYGYDLANNQTSVTDPLGKTVTAAYDALNRTISQNQPGGNGQTITTSFGYDADSNTTRYTDPNGNATTYTFNSLGLPETTVVPGVAGQTDAADRTTYLRYDIGGRQTSVTRPGNVTLSNTYDDAGRLIAQSGSGAEAVSENRVFDYDAADRLVSAGDSSSASTYTYDDRGLMLTAKMAGWDTAFGYDDAGRLTSQTDNNGTTRYGYDDIGRQTSQADPLTGKTVTVSYDKIGQPTDVGYGEGGPTRTYTYDALHQLTSDVLKTASGTSMASVSYGYDAAGHLTSKTTAGVAGAGSNTYTYDDAGRLASWTAGSVTTPFSYDPAGNRTRAGPTSYTYNARSQLTSATTGSTSTSYTYTSRGTTSAITTGSTKTAITSDAFDQQITSGSTHFDYDALGRLSSRADTSGTRSFAYNDLTNGVVSDGVQTFERTAGGAPLSVSSNGSASFLNADRHGDITGTFTATGLNSSATYDPFGNVTNASGTRANLGYQGGWTDPSTNFVNAASRWYNPAAGGFTSADTQQNPPTPAVNANPYAYGNDDPLNNSDPTGHDACGAYEATAAAMKTAIDAGKHLKWFINPIHIEPIGPPAPRNPPTGGGGTGAGGDSNPGGNGGAGNGGSQTNARGRASSGGFSITLLSEDVGWRGIEFGTALATGGLSGSIAGLTSKVLQRFLNSGPKSQIRRFNPDEYGLAASASTSCTAGNAPPKPNLKTKSRTKDPAAPTGPTGDAPKSPEPQPDPVPTPNEDPNGEVPTLAPQGLPSPDDCFQGAYQRTDGTRTGGMWLCDGSDDEGGAANPRYWGPEKDTLGGKKYYAPETPGLVKAVNPEGGLKNCGIVACEVDSVLAGNLPSAVPGEDNALNRPQMEERTGRTWEYVGTFGSVIQRMQSAGSGSRAIVGAWFENENRMGHYFNVFNEDGRVVFVDGQAADQVSGVSKWRRYYLMRMD